MLNTKLKFFMASLALCATTLYPMEKQILQAGEELTNKSLVIIGAEHIGLVTSACFAEFGFDVTNVDSDETRISALKVPRIPIYEPGLDYVVLKGIMQGKLKFSTDLATALKLSHLVMIAIDSPQKDDGEIDLSCVFQTASQIATHLTNYTVIATKSDVPVGTTQKIAEIIEKTRPSLKRGINFDVASNPEFIRKGSAMNDFRYPDRIVIGTDSERAKQILAKFYKPLTLIETPILFTNIETSELIKYTANSFLALKVTFANQLACLCEKVGADVEKLMKGVGLDNRIGHSFLNPGPGFGGSLAKDTLTLSKTAHDNESALSIIDSVINSNEEHKQTMASKIILELKNRRVTEQPRVAVLGITFKPNTDDFKNAASLVIVPALQKAGIEVCVYDPLYFLGSEKLKLIEKEWPKVNWAADPYEAIENSDAVAILTEWDEFKKLDLKRVASILKSPEGKKGLVIDYRNIFKLANLCDLEYHSIGRTTFG